MQSERRARSRALFSAGSSMPARIAMIAITIRSSINVKRPVVLRVRYEVCAMRAERLNVLLLFCIMIFLLSGFLLFLSSQAVRGIRIGSSPPLLSEAVLKAETKDASTAGVVFNREKKTNFSP